MTPWTIVLIIIAVFALIVLASVIKIVPQKRADIVERLGKYCKTLDAGFHILRPFIDKIFTLDIYHT